jgi:Xaa-Pro aminopeptidase
MMASVPFDHAARIRRASEAASRASVDALLVAPGPDLVYLSGYDPPPLERLTALVIRAGRDPAAVVPALERPRAEDAGLGDLVELASWGETEDPYRLVADLVGGSGRVGCSDRMWAVHLLRLESALPEATFVPAGEALGALRSVKDDQELGLLKRAARAADEAFNRILGTRIESLSETEVAARLADLLVETGHEAAAFTIVGSGPNGASPHHEPGHRQLQQGDAVVMDFGGRTGGYHSDLSRTVAVGRAGGELPHVHEVVREAQEAAFRAVRPGIPAQEVDRAARTVIEEAGFGERFIHRTGHGIGLEEHESPYIVEGNEEPLRPGMCFSIEPGIYLPGEFGVRIEDIVTVTEDGGQRLNLASRDLEVVR